MCVNACCIYSVKPIWRHSTASALTSLIGIWLRGEGRLRRAESVLQNCVMGRCAICIFMYCYTKKKKKKNKRKRSSKKKKNRVEVVWWFHTEEISENISSTLTTFNIDITKEPYQEDERTSSTLEDQRRISRTVGCSVCGNLFSVLQYTGRELVFHIKQIMDGWSGTVPKVSWAHHMKQVKSDPEDQQICSNK